MSWLDRLRDVLSGGRNAGPDAALLHLHRTLRGIRFQPRASLGPEVLTRARRGEGAPTTGSRPRTPLAWAAGVAVLGVLGGVAIGLVRSSGEGVSLDRCCFDLDGAGPADDGLVIVTLPGERVARVLVYQDADGSHSFTPGDPVRLEPGGSGRAAGASGAGGAGLTQGLVTLNHCCWDFDAGQGQDDGVMIVSAPPDRVLLAAIYESRVSGGGALGAAPTVDRLRYVLR